MQFWPVLRVLLVNNRPSSSARRLSVMFHFQLISPIVMHERHWQENNKHHLVFQWNQRSTSLTHECLLKEMESAHTFLGDKTTCQQQHKESCKTRSFVLSPLFELRTSLVQHPSDARVLQFSGSPAGMAQHYWRVSLGAAAEKHRTCSSTLEKWKHNRMMTKQSHQLRYMLQER